MSNFRVNALATAFSAVILAAAALNTGDTSPKGLYTLDERTSFNVLDAVTQDPASGQITLFGHKDPRFGETKIPYLQHLAILLESPAPEFSLESTSTSKAQIDAMFRRFDDPKQLSGMAFGWGKMFDQNGEPTAAGRYFLPLLGIKPLTGSWKGVDQFGRIGAVYRAAGNETAAETIELYGKFQNDAYKGELNNAILELVQVAGKKQELSELRKRFRQSQLSEDQQEDLAIRLVAESLDSGLGLKGAPATAAYDRARARGIPPAKAYDNSVVPVVNDQLQSGMHDVLESLFDRTGEIQIPADVLAETAGVAQPEVIPAYYGIDEHSQLARLFFEADYLGKSLMNKPELTDKIPGYQTEFAFERSHPSISATRAKQLGNRGVTSHCRFWFTADKIDLTETADHRALATRVAKMRINFGEKGVNSADSDCTHEYGELLTVHYDELALQFPTLHELQEAAKLAGVAQWLRKQQPELRLVQEGRSRWTGPDRVPGFVFLAWSSRPPQPGAPAISAIVTGGVSLKLAPTAAIPAKGSVDVGSIENCPDVPPPSSGAPIGWTTGGASGDVFAVTISTRTSHASDGHFLTPSPKGYTVLWSPTAVSTHFLSAACQQSFRNYPITASKPAQSQYADLVDELKPLPTKEADAPVAATDNLSGRRLDALINAVREAAKDPDIRDLKEIIEGKQVTKPRCNLYVAKVGNILKIPYFNHVRYHENGRGLPLRNQFDIPYKDIRANDFYAFLEKAVSSKNSGWRKINPEDAQALANEGKFVVGVAKGVPSGKMGHAVLAVPVQLSKEMSGRGPGPWVLDSASPDATVRAGVNRFLPESPLSKPIWAVWEGEYR